MLDDETIAALKASGIHRLEPADERLHARARRRRRLPGLPAPEVARGAGPEGREPQEGDQGRSSVAYGTDAGVQIHGINGRQLATYVDAGMTPLQAIQSATLVAARLLRMETKIGKVAPGFYGDLVAVAGDPLKNVRTIESPLFVMKEGRLVFEKR